jgi:hypothetical protein
MNAVRCTNPPCQGFNTMTHYFHIDQSGTPHDFEVPNPPPPAPIGVPQPQPCPVNGCYTVNQNPPPTEIGNPVFTYCLDCGNVEPH